MLPIEGLISQINVEIDGLASAAAVMRDELEHGYRSQVPQVHEAMTPGATIGGRIAGAEWIRLQDTYSTCIQATVEALFNLDKGTQAMARAAEKIAQSYRGSDAFAQATVGDVREVLLPPEVTGAGATPAAPTSPGGGR
ncbi:hypothetical protein [Plantactinospora sp. CA-290183]|uniref:hypothetical protein n=1 Tax=Plantactinospora sp. CA-290183 TaxID=3240006 RepID=UPI003D9168A2